MIILVFIEKKGSPIFVKDTIEKIRNSKVVEFSCCGIEPDALFDGISFGPKEHIYVSKLTDDVYLAHDGKNTYALTPNEMLTIHAELFAVHNKRKESLQK